MASNTRRRGFNFVLARLVAVAYEATATMKWGAVAGLVLLHMVLSWVFLGLAGETEITAPATFIYFYAVTASTVGYGDFSPVTTAGQMVLAFFVMPGSLAVFATFLGKVINTVSEQWRKALQGKKDYSHLTGHTVVFGWDPLLGSRLISYLRDDPATESEDIVLVASDVGENPLPDTIKFVSAASISSADALARSGVANACVAIIVGADDNVVTTVGLAVGALKGKARIVARFADEEKARIFENTVPNSECSVALTMEMMARTARDPGTSDLQRRILSVHDDHTQFSATIPAGASVLYGEIFTRIRRAHAATAIGMMRTFGQPDVNPPDDFVLETGDSVYYIAPQRIPSDAWADIVSAARTAA